LCNKASKKKGLYILTGYILIKYKVRKMTNDIIQNPVQYFINQITPEIIASSITFLVLILLALIFGYALGYIVSTIIKKISKTKKLEINLVKYGAVTSNLWESMINLVSEYLKWLILLMSVDMIFTHYGIVIISQVSNFLIRLFALVICTIIGILLGGVAYKITKDFLISVGLERELGKHHLADSMAGISVSTIVAFIVKWYIVLLFLTTGLQIFKPVIFINEDTKIVLLAGMEKLTNYVPQAMLGIVIILVSIIISDFVSEHIKSRTTKFSDMYALSSEIIIISIGALLALPHFGVKNTYFLEYSFIILVAGISMGIAIAIGMSFKERIKDIDKT